MMPERKGVRATWLVVVTGFYSTSVGKPVKGFEQRFSEVTLAILLRIDCRKEKGSRADSWEAIDFPGRKR